MTVMLLVVVAVRPRLSVTVIVTLDVPLFFRTPEVKDAAVKFVPWMVVLYALIVDDKEPLAVTFTASFDLFWTYAPNCEAMPETASEMLTDDIDGTTVDGTVSLKFLDTADPIFVLPE